MDQVEFLLSVLPDARFEAICDKEYPGLSDDVKLQVRGVLCTGLTSILAEHREVPDTVLPALARAVEKTLRGTLRTMLAMGATRLDRPVTPMEMLVGAWALGHADRLDKTAQMVRVAVRDRGARCAYCDLDLIRYDTYWVRDHVTPLSSGGATDDDNVVNACKDCNHLKRRYQPHGDTFQKRVADARRHVTEQRVARVARNRPDLLERLIEEQNNGPS